MAGEQEVAPHRAGAGADRGGHVGSDGGPSWRHPGVHCAAGRAGDGLALPEPRVVYSRGSGGHPAVPAADHAPHCSLVACPGWCAADGRTDVARPPGLRHWRRPAVCPSGARRARQIDPVLGAAG